MGETLISAGNTAASLFVANTSPITHIRIFNWNSNALVGTLTGGTITVLGK
jgi:hypothetical protein